MLEVVPLSPPLLPSLAKDLQSFFNFFIAIHKTGFQNLAINHNLGFGFQCMTWLSGSEA
jgi:hypothetical protein